VTRNVTPMAELRPLSKLTFVSKGEALRGTAHLPPVDGRQLHAELDELFDPEPYRD
jgi:hypothetical protein